MTAVQRLKNYTSCKDWIGRILFSKSDKFSCIFLLTFWTLSFLSLPRSTSSSPWPITSSYKLGNSEEVKVTPEIRWFQDPNIPNWNLPNLNLHLDLNGKETLQSIDTQPWSIDTLKEDTWRWGNKFGTDDKHIELASSIVEIIVYIILALVLVSFVSFLICLCCPFCVLSKIRHRRTRTGLVYTTRQTPPGILTGTITAQGHSQGTHVVAIANQRSNAPYPVQESVTLIPLVTPLPHRLSYSTTGMGTQEPGNVDLQPYIQSQENGLKQEPPPPYPGFVTVNADSTFQKDPPPSYNPYFDGGDSTK